MNFVETAKLAIELDRYGFKPIDDCLLLEISAEEWVSVEPTTGDRVKITMAKEDVIITRECCPFMVTQHLQDAGLVTPEQEYAIYEFIDTVLAYLYAGHSPKQTAEAIWYEVSHDDKWRCAYQYFEYQEQHIFHVVDEPCGREGRFMNRTWEYVSLMIHEEWDYEQDMNI